MATEVDKSRVEEGQHALLLQVFEVLVVGKLHLVHEVHYLFYILLVRDMVAHGVLHGAIKIDSKHTLGACADAACAEGVGKAVVGDFVAQSAAGGKRVGIVAQVGEERVPFGVHLRSEIGILLVLYIAVLAEERHGLDGEGEHGAGTLGVEPTHKTLLQPVERIPMRAVAVRETKLAEDTLEIVAVVVTDIPKDGLEVSGT